jgi:hypothetical protein
VGPPPPPRAPGAGRERRHNCIEKEDIQFDAGMVRYVQMVTSLIEGRSVSRGEILRMLNRTMKQHRLGRERRIDYILRYLTERPP